MADQSLTLSGTVREEETEVWWSIFQWFVNQISEQEQFNNPQPQKPKSEDDDEEQPAATEPSLLQRGLSDFKKCDQDGSGTVSQTEFRTFVEEAGLGLNPEAALELFSLLDKDKSGTLDFSEFFYWLASSYGEDSTEASSSLVQVVNTGLEACQLSIVNNEDGEVVLEQDSYNQLKEHGFSVPESVPEGTYISLREFLSALLQEQLIRTEDENEPPPPPPDGGCVEGQTDEVVDAVAEPPSAGTSALEIGGSVAEPAKARCTRVAASAAVQHQGQLEKAGSWFSSTFKARWFQLKGKTLSHYLAQGDFEPLGSLDLTNATVTPVQEDEVSFSLVGPFLNRTHCLRAPSSDERAQWVIKIRDAIQSIRYKEGWLHKLSEHGKWKQRYFVMSNCDLWYFTNHNKVKALECINIEDAFGSPAANHALSFMLNGPHTKRVYVLAAATKDEKEEWMASLFGPRQGKEKNLMDHINEMSIRKHNVATPST
eukprot:TRINITY_DN47192_c0_g1_i1.p1 TRINITY_DN47192_c0_g1~~TRINITY_DN47192_c0_g1_i1.p1  ORF type:complete len:484 (+),score=50.29 TRINITY_DN47192_c0_g1_i1:41-1492(+)